MTDYYNRPLHIHIELKEGLKPEQASTWLQAQLDEHLPGAQIHTYKPQPDGQTTADSQTRCVIEFMEVGMLIFHVVIIYEGWKQHKKMDQVLNEVRQLETILKNNGLQFASYTVETLNGRKSPEQLTAKDLSH